MIFVLSTGEVCHWQCQWSYFSEFMTLKFWKNKHTYKLNDNCRNWGFNYKSYAVYFLFLSLLDENIILFSSQLIGILKILYHVYSNSLIPLIRKSA